MSEVKMHQNLQEFFQTQFTKAIDFMSPIHIWVTYVIIKQLIVFESKAIRIIINSYLSFIGEF